MLRREAGDMYGQISTMQVAQADIFQQLTQIQMNMNQMRKDLEDSRAIQDQQNQVIRELLMSLTEQGIRGIVSYEACEQGKRTQLMYYHK